MTSALQPPGGIYWRAAVFAPFTISMPITIGMGAHPWPNVDLAINMPIQIGMSSPASFGIRMSLFVGMFGKTAAPAEFSISMPIQIGMSPFTPLAIELDLEIGMDVDAITHGVHINTAVQRAATI